MKKILNRTTSTSTHCQQHNCQGRRGSFDEAFGQRRGAQGNQDQRGGSRIGRRRRCARADLRHRREPAKRVSLRHRQGNFHQVLPREKKALETAGQLLPLKRVGQPEDIAKLVAFLIDNDKSGFVTGSEYVIDGGLNTSGGFKVIEGNPVSQLFNFNERRE